MDAVATDGLMPEDDLPDLDPSQRQLGFPYKRILIYGVTGSGKTTMAKHLSKQLDLPYIDVDSLTWEPNWVEVPLDIQEQRIRDICARDGWILDSAYGKWVNLPLDRVELVIGLDYSRMRVFSQLLRRTLRRAIKREPVCNGNVEQFSKMFSKDSILLWQHVSFHRKRERIHRWAAEGKFEVKVLKRPIDFDLWLVELDRSKEFR